MKIRRPMTLHHPVLPCACVSRVGETYKRDFCMCGKRQTKETCVCVKTDIQKRETYLYTKYPEDRPSRCITCTCEKRRFYKCVKRHSKKTSVYKVPARSSESMHHLIHPSTIFFRGIQIGDISRHCCCTVRQSRHHASNWFLVFTYGVATMSRLLKIISLFCRI